MLAVIERKQKITMEKKVKKKIETLKKIQKKRKNTRRTMNK
jgi:hypothetical protein